MTQRILGLDYGSQRIGVSISDPLGITARPLLTVPRNPKVFLTLKELVQQESVAVIVVGMPYNLKGEKTQKAQEVAAFIEELRATTGCEIIPWDERFTTVIAQQTLRTMGTKRKKRDQKNGALDQMAAALILQSYLDSTKNSLSC